MMPSDVLQQKLADLPGPVQDYLYSEQAGDLNEKIISRNKLSEGQEPMLFGLLRELFVKQVPLERLVAEIKDRFNFDETRAKQLAVDIAGFRLLPLDKWLGDVDGYIRSLGGDAAKYPDFRVQIEHRTPEAAAQDIVEGSVSGVVDPLAQTRLRGVVESF
ncbi:MAG TPA: hypothetical protein VL283_03625, partial [Candidatus Baltobacteraceae bacterium]|nr:hypothetical protein [Candidatus Baltobacteraceae bacterium]